MDDQQVHFGMVAGESELVMVRRHIAQGERHVREQRRRIARLREIGGDTAVAEAFLADIKALLVEHHRHLERLLAQ